MQARKQNLECRKCGATGEFSYTHAGAFEPFVCLALTDGFTYEKDTKEKVQRIKCHCGELVYLARYIAKTNEARNRVAS